MLWTLSRIIVAVEKHVQPEYLPSGIGGGFGIYCAPSEGTEGADLDQSFSRNLISGELESARLKIGYRQRIGGNELYLDGSYPGRL